MHEDELLLPGIATQQFDQCRLLAAVSLAATVSYWL